MPTLTKEQKLERKWVANFQKCALINGENKIFNSEYAYQVFYGKQHEAYPLDFPENFASFYRIYQQMDQNEAIDKLLVYLHFFGIVLHKENVIQYLETGGAEFLKLMNVSYNLLRMFAHYKKMLNISSPFRDYYDDIYFLLNIETHGIQTTIYGDLADDLKDYYNTFKGFPEGYERDESVKELFEKIENSGQSFFVTGKAGTGKSTFIHYFAKNTRKEVLLCACTGIAAVNVGGQTIHSLFKFPLKPLLPKDDEIKVFGKDDPRRKIFEQVDTIIIDEVSMLRSDLLEAMDYSLRINGGDRSKLFGGKQILFFGDVFQLPPVVDNSEVADRILFTEVYKSQYFFDAPAYKMCMPNFYEFSKVHRQNDANFIELLDRIRTCQADDILFNLLNKRFDPEFVAGSEEFIITLTSTNYIAGAENSRRLQELDYTLFESRAHVDGEFGKDRFPTDYNLQLKMQAQVIFIKNDPMRRWVNGTIGKISFVSDDILEIRLPDGSAHLVQKETWENRKYSYDRQNRKIVSEVVGTFTQFPIKLAWAITIHKSQGLTFEKVIIDLGRGAFVNGQLYTALSRCKSLDGIVLKREIREADIIVDGRIFNFSETQKLIASLGA